MTWSIYSISCWLIPGTDISLLTNSFIIPILHFSSVGTFIYFVLCFTILEVSLLSGRFFNPHSESIFNLVFPSLNCESVRFNDPKSLTMYFGLPSKDLQLNGTNGWSIYHLLGKDNTFSFRFSGIRTCTEFERFFSKIESIVIPKTVNLITRECHLHIRSSHKIDQINDILVQKSAIF